MGRIFTVNCYYRSRLRFWNYNRLRHIGEYSYFLYLKIFGLKENQFRNRYKYSFCNLARGPPVGCFKLEEFDCYVTSNVDS